MSVGRKRKPTALKLLEGSRIRNKGNEPKPTGIPTCPKHLDKAAKAEWKRISEELLTLGLLTRVDRAALGAYCTAYARWATAETELQRLSNGDPLKSLLTISPKSKYPVVHPLIGISNSAAEVMRKFLIEFGLTPASRSRLSVEAPTKPGDAFTEFMQSIGGNEIEIPSNDEEETIVQRPSESVRP